MLFHSSSWGFVSVSHYVISMFHSTCWWGARGAHVLLHPSACSFCPTVWRFIFYSCFPRIGGRQRLLAYLSLANPNTTWMGRTSPGVLIRTCLFSVVTVNWCVQLILFYFTFTYGIWRWIYHTALENGSYTQAQTFLETSLWWALFTVNVALASTALVFSVHVCVTVSWIEEYSYFRQKWEKNGFSFVQPFSGCFIPITEGIWVSGSWLNEVHPRLCLPAFQERTWEYLSMLLAPC